MRTYAVWYEQGRFSVEGVCNTPLQRFDFTTDRVQLRNSEIGEETLALFLLLHRAPLLGDISKGCS